MELLLGLIAVIIILAYDRQKSNNAQAKPKNPNTGINVLLVTGSTLVIWAVMSFIGEADESLVPPVIIITTLLSFAAGTILYKKVDYLQPMAMAFTYISLAIFPFLYYAYLNMGLEPHYAGLCSTISTFVAFTLAGWITKKRIMPYFAYIWLAAIIFAIIPESCSTRAHVWVYFLTPMIMAFPPMYAWVNRAKWLPVCCRHAARTYANCIIPAMALPLLVVAAEGEPSLLASVMAIIATVFYGYWWFKTRKLCLFNWTRALAHISVILITVDVVRITLTGTAFDRFADAQLLITFIVWVACAMAQVLFGLIFKHKNEAAQKSERIAAALNLGLILWAPMLFEMSNDKTTLCLAIICDVVAAGLGIVWALRSHKMGFAVFASVSLLIVPLQINSLGVDINEWVLMAYYTIASVLLATAYLPLRKLDEKQALYFSVISVSVASMLAVSLAASVRLSFVGWMIATVSIAIIAILSKSKAVAEATVYLGACTLCDLIGYAANDMFSNSSLGSHNRIYARRALLSITTTTIYAHIYAGALMGVAWFRERGGEAKVRLGFGYGILTFITLFTALNANVELNNVIFAVIYLVEQAAFMIYGVAKHKNWLMWVPCVAIILDILILSRNFGSLSMAGVGILLLLVAGLKMSSNHQKNASVIENKKDETIEKISAPDKAELSKIAEKIENGSDSKTA